MSECVTAHRQDTVTVITVSNPPVNALSAGVPEQIVDCVDRANADAQVQAIVLIGAGRGFIAGADIKQLGEPRSEKALSMRTVLEQSPKPIVAAIHGHALGGGLETALACHYRIAVPGAILGLPEVLIGILPGGGGTQRLPRLIGPRAALDLIVTGRYIPANEAASLGMIDELVADGTLESAAVAFAKRIAGRLPPPKVRDQSDRLTEAALDPDLFAARSKKIARSARNQRAPYACIEAVQAAVSLPFEQGLAKEQALFQELVNADEAKALRYVFFAERAARRAPGVAKETPIRAVRRVGIVGAGTMGGGIAIACANAGIPVQILERDPESMQRGLATIRANFKTSVKRGSITHEAMRASLGRIEPVTEFAALEAVDFVIEAVFERIEVKKEVFAKLDRVLRAGAVLASNTSALNIDEIAAATGRPEDVVVTHFFSPANVMKLLEIVPGQRTAADVVATAMSLGRRIDKTVAVSGNCYGFVANRSRYPLAIESAQLLLEGASPQQLDAVMVNFGFPVGPFVVADIAGLDVGYAIRQSMQIQNPASYSPNLIADRLYQLGRYGQKTGAGFYRYQAGDRTPRPDAQVMQIIEQLAHEQGIEQRKIRDDEILKRLLFAAVNESARILEEGYAYRASDVDVMWIAGFSFPRYRGGLLYWADQIGARAVYDQIRLWEQRYGERWSPAPLLQRLAESDGKFTGDVLAQA